MFVINNNYNFKSQQIIISVKHTYGTTKPQYFMVLDIMFSRKSNMTASIFKIWNDAILLNIHKKDYLKFQGLQKYDNNPFL